MRNLRQSISARLVQLKDDWLIFVCAVVMSISLIAISFMLAPNPERQLPEHVLVDEQIQYLQDPDSKITLEDIQQHQFFPASAPFTQRAIISKGVSGATFWLTFNIRDNRAVGYAKSRWYVELAYPTLNEVEFFLIDNHGRTRERMLQGDHQPLEARPIPYANPVFPFEISKHKEYQVFIRVKTDGFVYLPVYIHTPEQMYQALANDRGMYTAYYGLMVGLWIFNFFIFIIVRIRAYAYYLGFLWFAMAFQAVADGYWYQYLYIDSYFWLDRSQIYLPLIAGGFALMFVKHFLQLGRHLPHYNRLIYLALALNILAFLVEVIVGGNASAIWAMVTILVALSMLWFVGLGAHLHGIPQAKYFLLPWTILTIMAATYILANYGWMSSPFLTNNSLRIGTALEALLLSIALAQRINQIRNDKLSVQQALNNELERQVAEFARVTRELAKGNYSAQLSVDFGNQLSSLANDFNGLARSLNDSERLRKQWISDISHEMRTPLSVLRAQMEAVLDGIDPLDLPLVKSLLEETIRLEQVVSDIHQLSLSDTGQLEIHLGWCDPMTVIREQLALYKVPLEQAGIKVNVTDKAEATQVWADPNRLGQIIANLLQNTLRYTQSPGKLIVTTLIKNKQWVLIWEDSEPGVPDEQLPYLFDRLYRLERSRNRAKGGSGLGLAICHSLINQFQGQIEAQKSYIGGVKFIMRLNRYEPEVLDDDDEYELVYDEKG
jgi:signal transduction histidine kinase